MALRENEPPSSRGRLARIQRVSRIMAAITLVPVVGLLVVPILAVALAFLDPATLDARLVEALAASQQAALTPATRLAALALAAIPLCLALLGFVVVQRLFHGFATGNILTPESGRRLKRIGLIVTALGPVAIVIRSIASVVVSLPNPPGERVLAVGFGSNDITTIIAGMLMIVLGWTLEEAARVADENRQFV
ncbi:DUF2975 domain-containing protein [Stappia stellulata]|uniref:DUF2975 domain-containing protein n=1 Tax=Stappia stellulata TaxID=71235 RepID=UPI001CD3D34F|nr:DUF2975 domain-containing protein [Stappia stellulata]MCA1243823.1 DUF2975 domain-containing protein [Stappia stellulata]